MRREPYTEAGIKRVPCERCGEPSAYQWQICATGNKWSGVCVECDIALNELVVEFMGMSKGISRAYAAAKRVLHDPANSKKAMTAAGRALGFPRRKFKDPAAAMKIALKT